MQANDRDPLNRTQAPATGQSPTVTPNTLSDQVVASPPREGFLTGSFAWMFIGVLLSAASAVFVMNSPQLQQTLVDSWLFVLIGWVALAFGIMFVAPRIPAIVALGAFFVFALASGLMFGVIAQAYVATGGIESVVSAFLGAAAIFGGAAAYGVITKRDLNTIGGILTMGLLGLIVVIIAQIFLFPGNGLLNLAIGIGGVILFTGLTAWDVQKLKNGQMQGINKESATVMGALMLYLDFINLFLFMLRIMGSSR